MNTANLENAKALVHESTEAFFTFLQESGTTLIAESASVAKPHPGADLDLIGKLIVTTSVQGDLEMQAEILLMKVLIGELSKADFLQAEADLRLALELNGYDMLVSGRASALDTGQDEFVSAYDEQLAEILADNPKLPELVAA